MITVLDWNSVWCFDPCTMSDDRIAFLMFKIWTIYGFYRLGWVGRTFVLHGQGSAVLPREIWIDTYFSSKKYCIWNRYSEFCEMKHRIFVYNWTLTTRPRSEKFGLTWTSIESWPPHTMATMFLARKRTTIKPTDPPIFDKVKACMTHWALVTEWKEG